MSIGSILLVRLHDHRHHLLRATHVIELVYRASLIAVYQLGVEGLRLLTHALSANFLSSHHLMVGTQMILLRVGICRIAIFESTAIR